MAQDDSRAPPIVEFPEQIRQLEQMAAGLVQNARYEEAEKIFREIARVAPRHLPALQYLGGRALERGELESAQDYFESAIRIAPRAAMLHQNLGIVLRARGYFEGALRALDTALGLRPDLPMAWVQRGDVLQALARHEDALASYWRAESQCGDLGLLLQPDAAPRQSHAVRRASRHLAQARLNAAGAGWGPREGAAPSRAGERIESAIRHMCRAAPPDYADPLQRPAYAYVPGLDARPFFEPGEFPFLKALERESAAIRRELRAVLAEGAELAPYVQVPKEHEGRWRDLNRSSKWSSYHLYRDGERLAAHAARCPRTLAAVEALPLVRMQGHAPEIFFSILEPGTHIPPHHGIANYKLAVHLALVVPPRCAIRVGDETRTWQAGKCLVFDDSFEHEAWNRSEELRVVLIFEIWNPVLSPAEREALSTAQASLARFNRKMQIRASAAAPIASKIAPNAART